jgi:hypothetical protein
LVPLDARSPAVGGAKADKPAAGARGPAAQASQNDDGYTEVQVPMPEAEAAPEGSGGLASSGLPDTGLELSLLLAAGMSMLGAGLLVLGLVRRPH